ncbi:hypothetical protein GEV33_006462 [Tenebrio molitor]|uniref:Uncharacterized protein n=1 Tax=Tenebrio molitor TaxID=7067 RepID=A0A8J6HKG3_TENMO|nr:hypothetical protein GEV33_006462 [Tenebrio molitor]
MCAPAVVKLSGSKSEALPAVTEVSERGTKLPQRIREAADIVGEPRVMVRRSCHNALQRANCFEMDDPMMWKLQILLNLLLLVPPLLSFSPSAQPSHLKAEPNRFTLDKHFCRVSTEWGLQVSPTPSRLADADPYSLSHAHPCTDTNTVYEGTGKPMGFPPAPSTTTRGGHRSGEQTTVSLFSLPEAVCSSNHLHSEDRPLSTFRGELVHPKARFRFPYGNHLNFHPHPSHTPLPLHISIVFGELFAPLLVQQCTVVQEYITWSRRISAR